jgi:hypothetical protein
MHHLSLSETIIQSGVAAASQEGGPHYLLVTLPLSTVYYSFLKVGIAQLLTPARTAGLMQVMMALDC